jgi:hypothetical protein
MKTAIATQHGMMTMIATAIQMIQTAHAMAWMTSMMIAIHAIKGVIASTNRCAMMK